MQPEAGLVKRCVDALEGAGWLVRKMVGNHFNRKGVPDLIVVKDGFHCWVEVKREGERLAPIQAAEHATLKSFGAKVFTAYTPKGAVEGATSMMKLATHDRLVVSSEIPGSN
jgi:hypothetical protein